MVENYLAMAQRFGIVDHPSNNLCLLKSENKTLNWYKGCFQAGISNDDFLSPWRQMSARKENPARAHRNGPLWLTPVSDI